MYVYTLPQAPLHAHKRKPENMVKCKCKVCTHTTEVQQALKMVNVENDTSPATPTNTH